MTRYYAGGDRYKQRELTERRMLLRGGGLARANRQDDIGMDAGAEEGEPTCERIADPHDEEMKDDWVYKL